MNNSAELIFHDISKMLSKSIHDINNPFCVIVGQLSILELLLGKDQVDIERLKKSVDKMKSGADKMKDRIEGLRDYYKVAMGDPHYQTWPALQKSLEYINMAFEDHNLDLLFPEGETSVNVQHLFMIHYYLVRVTLEQSSSQINVDKQVDKYIITCPVKNDLHEDVFFTKSCSALNAKTEVSAAKITITIPF